MMRSIADRRGKDVAKMYSAKILQSLDKLIEIDTARASFYRDTSIFDTCFNLSLKNQWCA